MEQRQREAHTRREGAERRRHGPDQPRPARGEAEYYDPDVQAQIRRYRQYKQRRRLRRRRQLRQYLIIALALVGVLALVMLGKELGKDKLAGVWAIDDTTVYVFDGRGHGALRLPLHEYAFSYRLKDGVLSIDFEEDTATDSAYTYHIDRSTLTLDNNTGSVFRLEKQK